MLFLAITFRHQAGRKLPIILSDGIGYLQMADDCGFRVVISL